MIPTGVSVDFYDGTQAEVCGVSVDYRSLVFSASVTFSLSAFLEEVRKEFVGIPEGRLKIDVGGDDPNDYYIVVTPFTDAEYGTPEIRHRHEPEDEKVEKWTRVFLSIRNGEIKHGICFYIGLMIDEFVHEVERRLVRALDFKELFVGATLDGNVVVEKRPLRIRNLGSAEFCPAFH